MSTVSRANVSNHSPALPFICGKEPLSALLLLPALLCPSASFHLLLNLMDTLPTKQLEHKRTQPHPHRLSNQSKRVLVSERERTRAHSLTSTSLAVRYGFLMSEGEHKRTMAMVMMGSSKCLMATLGITVEKWNALDDEVVTAHNVHNFKEKIT
ncbi:hypothetical protein E2C01_010797 [Portunus trituberculatus]|uniref:Uncharacterized protein n=1 Tax=Portunus trituberculatus TaxID=210409 RepID=A0A5B7D9C8_PORTR|nr:hypothetical protein [Portunus trituberculatus]